MSCLTAGSSLPSGGLCYVWSGLNRHPHHQLVPGGIHSSPEAGQLHPGPENAHFLLEPQAAGHAAGRTAADRRPLQVHGQAAGPSPAVRIPGARRGAVAVKVYAFCCGLHHPQGNEAPLTLNPGALFFPEPGPSAVTQNGPRMMYGCSAYSHRALFHSFSLIETLQGKLEFRDSQCHQGKKRSKNRSHILSNWGRHPLKEAKLFCVLLKKKDTQLSHESMLSHTFKCLPYIYSKSSFRMIRYRFLSSFTMLSFPVLLHNFLFWCQINLLKDILRSI